MEQPKRSRKAYWLGFALVAGLGAYGSFVWMRHEAGGVKNLLDAQYWKERSLGEDEYKPSLAYFRRGPRDKKVVCLTIDDGPHGQCTLDEFAAMRNAGVKATFFFVGSKMEEHPDLVRQALAEGHEVGNHTYTHPRLDQIPIDQAKQEIYQAEETFEEITGREMNLFRPPGMHQNEMILRAAKMLGYTTVGWNVGAHDFVPGKNDPKFSAAEIKELGSTPDVVTQMVLKNVKNGSIILLHDQPVTAAALPKIIGTLKAQGYEFVTCVQALREIDHPIEIAANPMQPVERIATTSTSAPSKEPGAAALKEIGKLTLPGHKLTK